MSQALERHTASRKAKEERERLTVLLHHVNVDTLWASILRAQKQSCRWVDGVTWHDYEVNLECKSRGSPPKRPTEERIGLIHRAGYTYRRQMARQRRLAIAVTMGI